MWVLICAKNLALNFNSFNQTLNLFDLIWTATCLHARREFGRLPARQRRVRWSTAGRPFLYDKFNLQTLSRVPNQSTTLLVPANASLLISRQPVDTATCKDDTLCIKPQQQPPEFNLSSFASSSRSDRLIIASLMGERYTRCTAEPLNFSRG